MSKELGAYQLDVHYPLEAALASHDRGETSPRGGFYTDYLIEQAAGIQAQASGAGRCGRDVNFWFKTEAERDAAADRVTAMNDPLMRVVRRTDLDPNAEREPTQ